MTYCDGWTVPQKRSDPMLELENSDWALCLHGLGPLSTRRLLGLILYVLKEKAFPVGSLTVCGRAFVPPYRPKDRMYSNLAMLFWRHDTKSMNISLD